MSKEPEQVFEGNVYDIAEKMLCERYQGFLSREQLIKIIYRMAVDHKNRRVKPAIGDLVIETSTFKAGTNESIGYFERLQGDAMILRSFNGTKVTWENATFHVVPLKNKAAYKMEEWPL